MFSPILSAASSESDFSVGGMFLFFFFAFALAAGIWLLLWLISGDDEESEVGTKPEPKPEPAPPEEAPAKAKTEPEPTVEAEEKTAADEELPDIDTASEVQAAELFSGELADGSVRQDSVYGIVYNEAPSEADDLKKIKGVAKVLEGKLNGVGVYRFKQIAVWTDAACKEFSKMLTFKDRIYRDNWIAQAKDFHREKYDEEL